MEVEILRYTNRISSLAHAKVGEEEEGSIVLFHGSGEEGSVVLFHGSGEKGSVVLFHGSGEEGSAGQKSLNIN